MSRLNSRKACGSFSDFLSPGVLIQINVWAFESATEQLSYKVHLTLGHQSISFELIDIRFIILSCFYFTLF